MYSIYYKFMNLALQEAKTSLKEGNHGFGAVIVKDDTILARAHDGEVTQSDPTSHAELNAIRIASQIIGRSLEGCTLIATHEPCPMCATAIIWSGIKTLVYGYSISEAIREGRNRIDLTCKELFNRAKVEVDVIEGVSRDQCALLYRKDVRTEIKKLRRATREDLSKLSEHLREKRIAWCQANRSALQIEGKDLAFAGYELLLKKLGVDLAEAPVVTKTAERVVFHSQNFCPTLEACKILDLNTRVICKIVNEQATDALIKQIDGRLEFGRNYDKLRPYCDYCEEMVILHGE